MKIIKENNEFVFQAAGYQLVFHESRPFVTLADAAGKPLAELFVLSSVHTAGGLDDTIHCSQWEFSESAAGAVFSQRVKSTRWNEKIYRFRCSEQRLSYEVEVVGQGKITDVAYFGGYYSASLRWGSGFFWSGQHFEQCFNPEPSIEEVFFFSPQAGATIDLCGVPIPGRGDWFFTPPPFCFAAQVGDQWLALGLVAPAGQHGYSSFQYRGQSPSGFHLLATFDEKLTVAGRYVLPAVSIDFGDDPYDALQQHVQESYRLLDVTPHAEPAEWWSEPIYCGWGSQCYLASVGDQSAPHYARQEHYITFLETLEQQAIHPGIVVLDDKWQADYGNNAVDLEKWYDLRGFIDEQHAKERHVLLWLKAWDPEGVPPEQCIRNAAGLPIAVDPTNPEFEANFRRSIRQMLSPDGYDADGFKIDFTARIPSSPGAQMVEDVWGLELMKRYLSIIYDEAKKTKPDALVMTHTPHPYLADVTDMIRLNDINIGKDVNSAMLHRARVASIACPHLLIDTDNWPITDRETWRNYVALQLDLGIPSLYFASHIDTTGEALDASDYELIRQSWARYRPKFKQNQTQDQTRGNA